MRRFILCGDKGTGKSTVLHKLDTASKLDNVKYGRLPSIPNTLDVAVADGVSVCDVLKDRALHTMSAAVSCADFMILVVSASRAEELKSESKKSLIQKMTTASRPDCLASLRPYSDTKDGRKCGTSYGHLLMGRMLAGIRHVIIVVSHMDEGYNDPLYQTCVDTAKSAIARCGMRVAGHMWTDKDGSNIVYPHDPSCTTLLELILDAAQCMPIPARWQGPLHMPVLAMLHKQVLTDYSSSTTTMQNASTVATGEPTIIPASEVLFKEAVDEQPPPQPLEPNPLEETPLESIPEYVEPTSLDEGYIQQEQQEQQQPPPPTQPQVNQQPLQESVNYSQDAFTEQASDDNRQIPQDVFTDEQPAESLEQTFSEEDDGLTDIQRDALHEQEQKFQAGGEYEEPVIVDENNQYIYESEDGTIDDYTPWSENDSLTEEELAAQKQNYQDIYGGYYYTQAEADAYFEQYGEWPPEQPTTPAVAVEQEGQKEFYDNTSSQLPAEQIADEWGIDAVEAQSQEFLEQAEQPFSEEDGYMKPVYDDNNNNNNTNNNSNIQVNETIQQPYVDIPDAVDEFYNNSQDQFENNTQEPLAEPLAEPQMEQSVEEPYVEQEQEREPPTPQSIEDDDSIICIGRLSGSGSIEMSGHEGIREIRMYDKSIPKALSGDMVALRLPAKYSSSKMLMFTPGTQSRRFKCVYRLLYHPAAIKTGHEFTMHVGATMVTCRILSFDLDLNDNTRMDIEYMRTGDCMVVQVEMLSEEAIVKPFSQSPSLGRFLSSYSGHITGYGVVVEMMKQQQRSLEDNNNNNNNSMGNFSGGGVKIERSAVLEDVKKSTTTEPMEITQMATAGGGVA